MKCNQPRYSLTSLALAMLLSSHAARGASPPLVDPTICRYSGILHEFSTVVERVTRMANNIDKYKQSNIVTVTYIRAKVWADSDPVFNDDLLKEFPGMKAQCAVIKDMAAGNLLPLCANPPRSLALGQHVSVALEAWNYSNTGGDPCLRIIVQSP